MYTKDAPVSYSQTSIRIIQKQSFFPYLIRLWNSAKIDVRENLNQFITQKYNSRNSNPIVLLYLWETFHKYYSLKAKAQYCILHYDLYKRNISDYVDITQTHNISSLHVKIILKLEKIFYKNYYAWLGGKIFILVCKGKIATPHNIKFT